MNERLRKKYRCSEDVMASGGPELVALVVIVKMIATDVFIKDLNGYDCLERFLMFESSEVIVLAIMARLSILQQINSEGG